MTKQCICGLFVLFLAANSIAYELNVGIPDPYWGGEVNENIIMVAINKDCIDFAGGSMGFSVGILHANATSPAVFGYYRRYLHFKQWSLGIGIGLGHIIDASDGSYDHVHNSVLHGVIESSIWYKNYGMGITHYSSPFHRGDGLNLLTFKWRW